MAARPVFVPGDTREGPLARIVTVDFPWNPGFAAVQKKKNVRALHAAAGERHGLSPLLEVSTKSDEELGRSLSAFRLRVPVAGDRTTEAPLECVFQGSKVFAHGGPYPDIFSMEPRAAKRDERLRTSGALAGFRFGGREFPLRPATGFYDWLYLQALRGQADRLGALAAYAGFTDIEFNPAKSLNCQARACATLVALRARGEGELEACTASADRFLDLLEHYSIG